MKTADSPAPHPFPPARSNEVPYPRERVLDNSRTGILQDLEDHLTQLCRLRERVEDEMEALLSRFQGLAVKGRLQLFVRRKERGAPPSWLYWARQSRKHSEFDGPQRRPRWHRRLKIRKRNDLSNAVHWNGLNGRRGEILRFFEPVQALNQAHKAIFQATAYLKRVYKNRLVRDLAGMPEEEGILSSVTGPPRRGTILREAAWKLQTAVEAATLEMEDCFASSLRSNGPFVLVPETRHLRVCKTYWLGRADGSIHRGLDLRIRRHPEMTDQRMSGCEQVEARRRRAHLTRTRALRLIHALNDRLLRGLIDGRRALAGCPPLDDYARPPDRSIAGLSVPGDA